jgi:hypothetical protein
MKATDRILGRAPAAAPSSFAVRPFGTSKAEAAAIAAAAAAAQPYQAVVAGDPNPSLQAGGRASGATGGAGSTTNLTTSSAPAVSGDARSSGSQLP